MNPQEVLYRIEQEKLEMIQEGEQTNRPLEDWGALLTHHAQAIESLALEGQYPQAQHQLRRLLAWAIYAAQQHGLPLPLPKQPPPISRMSDIRKGDKFLMPTQQLGEVRAYTQVTVVEARLIDGIQHIAAKGKDGNMYQFGDEPDAPFYLERVL